MCGEDIPLRWVKRKGKKVLQYRVAEQGHSFGQTWDEEWEDVPEGKEIETKECPNCDEGSLELDGKKWSCSWCYWTEKK